MTPAEVVRELVDGSLMVRVGTAVVAPQQLSSLEVLAVQWDCAYVDLVDRWLARLPQGTRFSGVTRDALLAEIAAVSSETHDRRCVALANVDVLLAKLNEQDRQDVWSFLFSSLKKQPTAVLLVLPSSGGFLVPTGEAERWQNARRMSALPATA